MAGDVDANPTVNMFEDHEARAEEGGNNEENEPVPAAMADPNSAPPDVRPPDAAMDADD